VLNHIKCYQLNKCKLLYKQEPIESKMQEKIFGFVAKYITLSEDEKKDFIQLNTFKSFKKGTVLLKEGEISDDCYFILQGCVRVYYIVDGEEKTTEFYTELDGINPHCAVDKRPSSYYIDCVEDCILTVGNPEMEDILFQKFPKFEILFRKLNEELFLKQQINFDKFKTSSPEQRYLTLLENRPDLIKRVPQQQLASFLGITPVSLSRLKARVLRKNKK
jgi:CRP-like cAMP-binding protein